MKFHQAARLIRSFGVRMRYQNPDEMCDEETELYNSCLEAVKGYIQTQIVPRNLRIEVEEIDSLVLLTEAFHKAIDDRHIDQSSYTVELNGDLTDQEQEVYDLVLQVLNIDAEKNK